MNKDKEMIFAAYRDILLKAALAGIISWAIFDSSLIEIRKALDLPVCKHC